MEEQTPSCDTKLKLALGKIAISVLMRDSIEDTTQLVLNKAKELTQSKFALIGHAAHGTDNLITISSAIATPSGQEGRDTAACHELNGLWAWTTINRKPFLANDYQDTLRSCENLTGNLPIRRFLSVPIWDDEKLVGMIAVANADNGYENCDVLTLEKLADLHTRTRRNYNENKQLSLFRRLIDQSNDAIYVVDPQSSRFLEINEAAHTLLGYERGEFLAKRVIDISATDPDLASWQRSIEYLRTVPYHVFEGEQVHKDGTRLPVEVNVRIIHQDDKEFMISVARDIRDRKIAADAIIEEKNKLAAVLEALGDGLTLQDREFKILYQNESHRTRQGDHQGELCYRAYQGLDQICDSCQLALCFADGRTHRRETASVGIDGKAIYMEVSASPVRDAQGNIYAGIETIRDITERKLVDEALRKNQNMLKHVLDSVPQYVFWKDIHSAYLGCNQAFAKAAGLSSPDQIVGKNDFDLAWLKEETEAYRADDQYVMSNNIGKLHTIEPQHQANGDRLWIDTSKVPLLDEQGKVYGVLGVFEDITERLRVEKSLQESESRYRLLFESAGDAIIISLNDIVMECNDKALNLFGCTDRAQIIKEPILKFSADAQLDNRPASEIIQEKVQAALNGEAQFFPWQHKRLDGMLVDTEVTLNSIDLGDAGNLLAIIRDVSAQKKSAIQLRQAQKMESIGTLAGGIAHDFNNILNAIIGYTDLAMMREKDESVGLQDDLRQVRKAADRATDLVRQILTFSRKQQQEKTPIQISLVVKEALKLLRASIPTTIDIRQEILSQGMVLADSTEIHQLIMNLCTNAFHAMADHGGVMGVSLKEMVIDQPISDSGITLPPGCYLVLSISDSGCGMDQETISKIFDPYFTTKEIGRGTGLGLAVVHGIIKGHHGEIAVYSEPGRGTTFTVYLPMIAQKIALAIAEEAPPGSKAHERVMIVEDESANRNLLCLFLTQAGYRVEGFGNGVEAWEAISQRPNDWDLLITDQTMPKMTGEQLAAKVQAIRPDLPIILCSGYSTLMGDKTINTPIVTAFLQKPISRIRLLTQVAKVLAAES